MASMQGGPAVLDAIAPFFQNLYDETGWNFVMFYERYDPKLCCARRLIDYNQEPDSDGAARIKYDIITNKTAK